MKRIFKIAGFVVAGILVILAVLLFAISTGNFNQWIATRISKSGSQQLNGKLTVKSIEGNPLSHFKVNGIRIQQEEKELASLDMIEIKLNPWAVLVKKIKIDLINLKGLQLKLEEGSDSLWNFQRLLPQGETAKKDTKSASFNWKIDLEKVNVTDLEADITPLNTNRKIPRSLKLDASLSFKMAPNSMKLNLDDFKLSTQQPSLQFDKLKFQAAIIDSVYSWQDFELQLGGTAIQTRGSIPLNKPYYSELSFKASPINFDELNEWLPGLHGEVRMELLLSNQGNSSNINCNITQNNQSIKIQGQIADLNSIPTYEGVVKIDSLNGEYWTHRAELQSNTRGSFEFKGKRFDFRKGSLDGKAQFSDLKYGDYKLDNLLLSLNKEKDVIKGDLKGRTVFGDLVSKFYLEEVFSEPRYDVMIQLLRLNLGTLIGDDKLSSNINLNIQANGQGVLPGEIEADIQLQSEESYIFGQTISQVNARLGIKREEYTIEVIHVETPYLKASLRGSGQISGQNQLGFSIRAENMEKTMETLGLPITHFKGELDGELSGPLSRLAFQSNAKIEEFRTKKIGIRNTQANINSNFSLSDFQSKSDSIGPDSSSIPINLQNLYLHMDAKIGYANFGNYYMENFTSELEKKEQHLKGKLFANTIFGSLETTVNISQMFTQPSYSILSKVNNINLAKITRNDTLQSDIHLRFEANGTGISPDSLMAEIQMQVDSSTFLGMPLDDFDAQLSVKQGKYLLQGFKIETPFVLGEISGKGHWKKSNQLTLGIQTKDIQKLSSTFKREDLSFEGQLETNISGPSDSIRFYTWLLLEELKVDSIAANRIKAKASLLFTGKGYSGNVDLEIKDARFQNLEVEGMQFQSSLDQEKVVSSFAFHASDSLKGNILSELHIAQNPSLYLPKIDLNIYNNHWLGGGPNSFIRFGKDSIEFHKLEITSEKSAVKVDGVFAFRGNEDLHLAITNMDLSQFSKLKLIPYQYSGKLNFGLDITGTAKNPVAGGSLVIAQPVMDQLNYSNLTNSFRYADEEFTLTSTLNRKTKPIISAKLQLPMRIAFTDSLFVFRANKPLDTKIKIDELDLGQFAYYLPLRGLEAKGLVSMEMDIRNTIRKPEVSGKFKLNKGVVIYNKLGIDYSQIEMRSQLKDNLFLLDTLRVSSGEGKLNVKGAIEIDSLLKGKIKNVDIKLKGENFTALNSEMVKAILNTDLSVKGDAKHSVFDGNITILSSLLNTDILLKEYNSSVVDMDQPLLVKAQEKSEEKQSQQKVKKDTSLRGTPDIYKNLKGQFIVEIPRNSWLKGKNMNFELAGKIKAIKDGEQIDFFGDLNIKRGYYKIYGRRLEVEEGKITLTGGQQINPVVNFKIAYKFRDPENQLQKLNLNISGRVSQPKVEFFLEDSPIEEKDAISYLLFNKSSSQLDTRETASTSKSNIDIAKDLAIGQISNVMKDALQSSLGLDVIEISGKGGGTQSSVSIGKYITNNLFLSYERTFTLNKKDKTIEPEKISMEYQFYRSLFLQATNQSTNSGFDFIIKWTWK
ncbi:translocation/assembly module TamB domain-containing protein [Ancylomarina sp.]|uniref:translocation/assembly module TamB domain-containing protein n=1 Tax=Ancylomarina sp. TaxID=1970196 RepID=UPI003566E4E5